MSGDEGTGTLSSPSVSDGRYTDTTMAQEVHGRGIVIVVDCFLGEAPVEAVVTKSRAGFNFSVITCREVAKLGGISKGHEWRGWVKSWVMVS